MAINESPEENTNQNLLEQIAIMRTDIKMLKDELSQTNDRVEVYQKASQQVVNLAFSLIIAATIAIVIPAIIGSS